MDIKSPIAEARNEYLYNAAGVKLRVTQRWNTDFQTSPIIGETINEELLDVTKVTDYVGNKIYENGELIKILVDGGYYDARQEKYYFYIQDHLGNNRVVADAQGNVVQRSDYYPFGMEFADNTDQDEQPYKYNGKELDKLHGLNMYDYSARYMEPAIGRFTSVDPMAEKYYSISPYAYVANNPLKYIDPTGMYIADDEKSAGLSAFINAEAIISLQLYVYHQNNTDGRYDRAIQKLESSMSDLDAIYNSEERYEISRLESTSKIGGFSYDLEKKTFMIQYFNLLNLAHEITHAGQYERGLLGFVFIDDGRVLPIGSVGLEVEAYRTQMALQGLLDNKSFASVNTNFVRNIYQNGIQIYPESGNAAFGSYIDSNTQYWAVRLGFNPGGITIGTDINDLIRLKELNFMKWKK